VAVVGSKYVSSGAMIEEALRIAFAPAFEGTPFEIDDGLWSEVAGLSPCEYPE
jgi:hypothetical protein